MNQQHPNKLDILEHRNKKADTRKDEFDFGLQNLKSKERNKSSPSTRTNLVRYTKAKHQFFQGKVQSMPMAGRLHINLIKRKQV